MCVLPHQKCRTSWEILQVSITFGMLIQTLLVVLRFTAMICNSRKESMNTLKVWWYSSIKKLEANTEFSQPLRSFTINKSIIAVGGMTSNKPFFKKYLWKVTLLQKLYLDYFTWEPLQNRTAPNAKNLNILQLCRNSGVGGSSVLIHIKYT